MAGLSIEPSGAQETNLATGAVSILLVRASGDAQSLDPRHHAVLVREEVPPLDRLSEDLGAICEVYRQSSAYFLSVVGVLLALGDTLTIRYEGSAPGLVLKVMDLEGSRARIEPPRRLTG